MMAHTYVHIYVYEPTVHVFALCVSKVNQNNTRLFNEYRIPHLNKQYKRSGIHWAGLVYFSFCIIIYS